jgi:hypothetical protein
MSKYFIGSLGFKTKKECESYTRSKINSIGVCVINKDDANYNFFIDLINNHPEVDEKVGCGVNHFFIQSNSLNRKAFQTMIKRTDDSEIDFSWIYCCQFKERSLKEHLNRAMRESISPFTMQYKKSQSKLICSLCKKEDDEYSNYHVDHNDPPFRTIRDNFLTETTKTIPAFFGDCSISKLTIFKQEDINFKNDWINYHNSKCTYQILCSKCNLKKH